MCGIFGVIRKADAAHPERATAVFAELGKKSVSRGRDSAGMAFIPATARTSSLEAKFDQANVKVAQLGGGIAIVKDTTTFDALWSDERDVTLASSSALMIGHTRAATQGNRTSKANASPLAVGTLIGTHNGDIDDGTLTEWLKTDDKKPFGGTDTEILFRAINNQRSHRKNIVNVLTAARGRIALAWYDRRLPGRMYFARGGLSPLSIAFDAEGNMYWASNPQWFRDIDKNFDNLIGFHSIFIVPEGRLITVRFDDPTVSPWIDDARDFTPTVRYSDKRLPESIVWRDFHPQDKKMDMDASIHNVTAAPIYKSTYTPSKYAGTESSKWNASSAARYSPYGNPNSYDGTANDRWAEYEEDAPYMTSDDEAVESDIMLDALEYCTEEEGLEAIERASEFLANENSFGSAPVREALMKAYQADSFDTITKDFGLSSDRAAQAFVSLVFSS